MTTRPRFRLLPVLRLKVHEEIRPEAVGELVDRIRTDGRVEAVFEGPAQDVQHLLDWVQRGPRLAVVADVAVQAEQPEGLDTFLIR